MSPSLIALEGISLSGKTTLCHKLGETWGVKTLPVGDRMALQLHHHVVVIGFQRQVAVLGITFEEPSFLEESR